MLVVGLTGGIGSGKSTFASLLAERGAQVIDADAIGHDVLHPGRPAWESVVGQFGEEVLASGSMEIDRKRLAHVVFGDKDQLAALNAIVHPAILGGIADELDRLRSSDAIVVIDAALIIETGLDKSVDVLIAVTSQRDVRTERLRHSRGMSPEQTRARMDVQLEPEELARRADIVVMNDGSIDDLVSEADRVWKELQARAG